MIPANSSDAAFEDPAANGTAESRLVLDLDGYEGPIDVLLALAREQKVDLTKITILDLAHRVVSMVGDNGESPATISFVPYEQAYPSGGFEEIPARQPEIAKIRSYTRWRPKLSLEDILRDVIAAHEVPHTAPVAEELLVPAIA